MGAECAKQATACVVSSDGHPTPKQQHLCCLALVVDDVCQGYSLQLLAGAFEEQYGAISPIPDHDGTECLKWDDSLWSHKEHFKVSFDVTTLVVRSLNIRKHT